MREFVEKIHERAVNAVRVYRQGQKELIQVIQEMDRCQGYRDFQCASLWQYCLTKLKLDESESSALISIARKSYEVPELKAAVEAGQIHISNARQIVPVLNRDNKSQWLERAQTLSKRELQKELADHCPKLATTERAKYVSQTRVQFQCGLNEEDFKEFLEVQNLVSQSKQSHSDYEQTLIELVRFYKQAKHPLLKAQRAVLRAQRAEARGVKKQEHSGPVEELCENEKESCRERSTACEQRPMESEAVDQDPQYEITYQFQESEAMHQAPERVSDDIPECVSDDILECDGILERVSDDILERVSDDILECVSDDILECLNDNILHRVKNKNLRRKRYPAELEHRLNLRDQRQCTHINSKAERCSEKKWLSFHHKIPVEQGGPDTFENLQTLCWAHHQLVHHKGTVSDRFRPYEYIKTG